MLYSRLTRTLAVASLLFMLCSAAVSAAELSATEAPRKEIAVHAEGRLVAIHHSGPALDKSYFHPLRTPDGRCITYDSPADHLHHRGLCIGWPDVSGVDFWAELNSPRGRRGRQVPREVISSELPGGAIAIVERNDWIDEGKNMLVQEEREWRIHPARGALQLLDVDIHLKAVAEKVVFGSDPKTPREYHGLTIRIGPFDQPKFFNSAGSDGDQACHGQPAKWCALSGLQNGRPVAMAILDHPLNGTHPTRFFVLGSGMQFISSSPNFSAPKILESGETWRLRYRVVAAGNPGERGAWDLDALWKEYASNSESP